MQVTIKRVDWPFRSPFHIAYESKSDARAVWIELRTGALTGRGEALGVSYRGETPESIVAQLEAVRSELTQGVSRSQLRTLLPPGGARNALDCALWDLEAKRAGRRAWELAGFGSIEPLLTDYTLGLDTPPAMAQAASAAGHFPVLKLKLGGDGDLERVAAVRNARPDAQLIVDANQSWNERQLRTIPPVLAELGVELIEQPLPAGQDQALLGFKSPIPLCADESCQTRESLPELVGKYQVINIKLDKTGGLTEALELAQAALKLNFELMVGCMSGSSLSMAPAFIVGQLCRFVDLDGPLLASSDVAEAIRYEGGRMFAPEAALWG